MGLGDEAWPIAGHVLVIVVLALTGTRVMRSFALPGFLAAAERNGLSAAAGVACAFLALERCWGIFARAMRGLGVDVYGAHPAPELMGLLTMIGLYGVGAVILVTQLGRRAAARRMVVEVALLLLLWSLVVAVLR